MPQRSIHQVCDAGKPRFQLRPGEEGLSVFDAEKVVPADIFPHFRTGNLITTQEILTIESFGLTVVKTPGEPTLPHLLQDNHMEIRPAEGMTRKQFKAALRLGASDRRFTVMVKTKLAEIQEKLAPHLEKVCLKGQGAASFVYAVNKGRAVEISEDDGGFWLEFWEKSDEEDAAPVKEMTVEGGEQAVRQTRDWLLGH